MTVRTKLLSIFVFLLLLITTTTGTINMSVTTAYAATEPSTASDANAEMPINESNPSAFKPLDIYLFYSKTCPHCKKEKEFLSSISTNYPSLKIHQYEITTNGQNLKLFVKTGERLGATSGSVPFLVIGKEYILGYGSDTSTGAEIQDKINQYIKNVPENLVEQVIKDEGINPKADKIPGNGNTSANETESNKTLNEDTFVNLPFLGNFNLKGLSLPIITLVIGLLDGFNPCAMWVLLFLISMLLGLGDRKKMWIIGLSFLGASGLVYFLFLSAWLNAFLLLGYAVLLRYAIGLLALTMGILYVRKYLKDRKGGCEVMEDTKRQRVFEKIKKIIQQQNLLLSIGGTVLLAGAVNVVELLCSAGLPAVYTRILSMNQMPTIQYYGYLLLYILFFMLDDLIVFTIAMFTLQTVGIKSKYSKYSQIIGAVLMIIIGVLMLFKPEVLMFG